MYNFYIKQSSLFKCGNVSLKVSTKQPANQFSNFPGWILLWIISLEQWNCSATPPLEIFDLCETTRFTGEVSVSWCIRILTEKRKFFLCFNAPDLGPSLRNYSVWWRGNPPPRPTRPLHLTHCLSWKSSSWFLKLYFQKLKLHDSFILIPSKFCWQHGNYACPMLTSIFFR